MRRTRTEEGRRWPKSDTLGVAAYEVVVLGMHELVRRASFQWETGDEWMMDALSGTRAMIQKENHEAIKSCKNLTSWGCT